MSTRTKAGSNELPVVGIVGGLGPAATIFYYRELVAGFAAAGLVPRMFLAHADVNYVLAAAGARRLAELAAYMDEMLASLEAAGATVTAISAVTPHIAEPLLTTTKARRIDLIDAVTDHLAQHRIRTVGILGTRFTVESSLFGRLDGVEIVQPEEEDIARMHELYLEIVSTGRASAALSGELRVMAQGLIERGADAVLLAGTELSLAFPEGGAGFPLVDAARVHVAAIVEAVRGGG